MTLLSAPALLLQPATTAAVPDIAPRRWLYLFLVLASTVAAVTQMAGVFQVDGFSIREIIILVLFAILFAWIASSFWMAVFGAFARLTRRICCR